MYPTLCISRDSFRTKSNDGQSMTFASSGKPKIKILNDRPYFTFNFSHWALTSAEAETIYNFYEGNKFHEFTFTNPDTDKTYVCRFASMPNPVRERGQYRDIEVEIIGYEQ